MAASNDSTGDDSTADGSSTESSEDSEGRPCPACGESMYRRHCKYVCPRHGVVYDCSDTFY